MQGRGRRPAKAAMLPMQLQTPAKAVHIEPQTNHDQVLWQPFAVQGRTPAIGAGQAPPACQGSDVAVVSKRKLMRLCVLDHQISQ